jgi:hypothetical protein
MISSSFCEISLYCAITFTFDGKEYAGELSQVQSAGSSATYHLMIKNYYHGCLRISLFNYLWVFDGKLAELVEGFGELLHLVNWIKCELGEGEEALFYNLIANRDKPKEKALKKKK